MNNYHRNPRAREIKGQETNEYPWMSIALAVMLLYMAPFVSRWLAVPSFLICLYRVLRYDARIFATDYGMLLPLVSLTNAPGTPSLLIYLCLLAAIWYIVKEGIHGYTSFVLLIALLNYLMTRMQLDINAFVLYFGQLFVLCVLLPKQDAQSAERTVKVFIASLIVSSVYSYLLRNTGPIRAISGDVSYAIWGTNIKRFKGLLQDPNYYMTLLVVGLVLLIKLRECGMLGAGEFVVQGLALSLFGALTYSKTFFLVFVLLGGIYVIWQFWSRKVIGGLVLTILALIALNFIVFSEASPFAVVIQRLLAADNISDLTTGRTEVYLYYWAEISSSGWSLLFGQGLAAEGLFKDPHNIYLEIMYYTGAFGLVLAAGVFLTLVHEANRRADLIGQQHIVARYAPLFMFLLLFVALHGMFQAVAHGELFLTILSLMITKKHNDLPEEESVEGKESGRAHRYLHKGH